MNPIISIGLNVLANVAGRMASQAPAAPVVQTPPRNGNFEQAAQELGVQARALQQAFAGARKGRFDVLDTVSRQLGVDRGKLQDVMQQCGLKIVDQRC